MDIDVILARFREAPDESWRVVADRIGVPYRRLIGWRQRAQLPITSAALLLRRAREIGVRLSPADFFDLADTSEAV